MKYWLAWRDEKNSKADKANLTQDHDLRRRFVVAHTKVTIIIIKLTADCC